MELPALVLPQQDVHAVFHILVQNAIARNQVVEQNAHITRELFHQQPRKLLFRDKAGGEYPLASRLGLLCESVELDCPLEELGRQTNLALAHSDCPVHN